MKITPPICIAASVVGIVTACNRENPNPPPPASQVQQGGTDDAAAKRKDEFLASMNAQMTRLDAKIDHLAQQAKDATGDARARADQALADLRPQREEVRKRYDKLKAASQSAWDNTKTEFQSAWERLVKTYDDTSAKLKSAPPSSPS